MSDNYNNRRHTPCDFGMDLSQKVNEMNLKLERLDILHNENKVCIERLKNEKQQYEVNIHQRITDIHNSNEEQVRQLNQSLTEIKEQFGQIINTMKIIKYSTIAAAVTYVVTQLGVIEAIKLMV